MSNIHPNTDAPTRSLKQSWRDALPFIVHYWMFGFGWTLFFAYIPLWLTAKNISPAWIGAVILATSVTRFCLTPVFSELSDRFGQRWWVVLMAYSILVPLTGLMMVDTLPLWAVYGLAVLYGGIFGVTLATLESYVLLSSKVLGFSYTIVRGILSLGVGVAAVLFGWIFQFYGVDILPLLVCLIFVILWVSMWILPRIKSERSGEKLSLFKPLAVDGVGVAIILGVLGYMIFSPYMGLGALFFVEVKGFSEAEFGWIMGVCVVAEALVFFYAGRRVQKWRVFFMLAVAFAITIVRFFGYKYSDGFIAMMIFHALHAFGFGLVHSMVMELYRRYMPPKHLSSATGLYDMCSAIGYGLGGAIGGYILEHYGVNQMIDFTLFVSVLALVIASVTHIKRTPKR